MRGVGDLEVGIYLQVLFDTRSGGLDFEARSGGPEALIRGVGDLTL